MYRRLILNSVNDVSTPLDIHMQRCCWFEFLVRRNKKKKETDRLCPADSLSITTPMNDDDQVVHIHMEQRW